MKTNMVPMFLLIILTKYIIRAINWKNYLTLTSLRYVELSLLINAINDTAKGLFPTETEAFLTSLHGELEVSCTKKTALFKVLTPWLILATREL